MATATIKLFLTQGDPKRLRTAEISNWTGKALAAPRTELEALIAREESSHSGVYFLTGTDPATGRSAVYIGEAEVIRDRIKGHIGKDFWNSIIFVISKDENLTKSHIRYLEGRLINQAEDAKRFVVVNSNGTNSKLPESDREDMEVFLDRIHQLIPVMGSDFLVPVSVPVIESVSAGILACEIKGALAKGLLGSETFLVLKGSQAVLVERPSTDKFPYARELRQKLLQQGVLAQVGEYLVFQQDTEFNTPSQAATVVHGGNTNGRIAWKDSQGRTINDIEEAELNGSQ